ncbi:unnamed protein product [Symbiodinium sp. CCMP2592]|nr:unnamed protein product [Symbiodinium sp. CCMP2592]
MSWAREQDWAKSSWASSSWEKKGSSGWNNRDWQKSPQQSVPSTNVAIPSSFTSDWECYDKNAISGKKFFRNIQSTPWSTKAGLAGKDVADLRVSDLTRKGLDDFSLRCLSNGEFQSLVFVRSISEAVFVTNLLRHIRQDRIDLDAVAANMHGPAPPDKHRESARFMQPLLGEIVSTIKANSPPPADSNQQSPESEQLARAKRKLKEAGIALTPEKKQAKTGPKPTASPSPSAEQILNAELQNPPNSVPSSSSPDVVENWLKKHQSQFRGQAAAFKKHVADVCSVLKDSATDRQSLADLAIKYGLKKSHVRKRLASAVCTLGTAAAFMLEFGDGIPMAPLIWVHTLMSLVLLFYLNAPSQDDSHRFKIVRRLQQFGVDPDTLHYSLFEKPNTVYCIFQVDFDMGRFRSGYRQPSSLLYVGSTAVGAAKRHLNRMAVYRRLQRTEFVDAELSLRYWASQHNLFQFVLVPLEFCDSYPRAWTVEHELIAQWQAPLNYPRAMSFIKKTALGFRISSKRRGSLYCTFGLRLWRKLRKRMFGRSSKFFIHDSRELAWGLLFKMASRTRASFETAKLLRSNKTADEEVYALIKLSRNIENPHRNRVQGILKGVVKFRKKMHWPRTSRPLGVLPTASPSFSKECEKWLQDLILRYKYLFPSFHVPKNSLREVPHQSIKKFLHNFRSWEETMWEHDFDLESVHCPCEQFAGKLPVHCFVSGHVATGLENLTKLLPGCSSILSASAASTFFPGRNHWMAKSRALFDQWLKRHKLPATLHPIFQSFCDHQWQQHVAALEQSDRLHWALVQKVKSALHSDFVLYNEDHHPNHVECYCPRFFLRGVSTTWNDPSVFRTLDGTPEEWRQRILKRVPRDLSRRYAWAFKEEYFNLEPWLSNTIFTSTEDPLECRLQADHNLRLQFFRLLRKLVELGRFRYTHHLELRFQFNSHRVSRPCLLTPAVSVMIAVARDDDGVDIIGMNVTLRDLPRPQFDQSCLPLSLPLDHQQDRDLLSRLLSVPGLMKTKGPATVHSDRRGNGNSYFMLLIAAAMNNCESKSQLEPKADRPFLPVIPIGQREIVTLARSILASKIPYKAVFQHDAKAYAMPQEALHVWEFPVANMPGPEEQTNCYYLWGHGTTAEGLVGILTLGRVIRSTAEAVHVAPHDHVCSFYGKATQNVYYEESKLDFVSKLHHSTKNSAGVVVGGYLGSAHHKSKSSSTVHEGHLCKFHPLVHSPSGDKRWAVREAAGRIDKIWILSSTHSITLPMSTPNNPRPITFETGEGQDWGVSWPGLEYSVRSTEALPVSDVQREA